MLENIVKKQIRKIKQTDLFCRSNYVLSVASHLSNSSSRNHLNDKYYKCDHQ